MTARNEEKHIRQAVGSILGQSLGHFELIVVDDCSSDSTREIVQDMAQCDPRITLLCTSARGRVACLNAALAAARAPYVAIMDADDLAHPDRLALQCAFLDRHPGVVALGGAVTYIADSEAAIPLALEGRKVTEKPSKPRSRLDGFPMWPLPIMHSAAMMRTEAVLDAGGYRKALLHQEDTDLFLRLEELGEVRNLPQVLHYYRQHTDNTSRRHFLAQCASRQLALVLARRRRLGLSDWASGHGRWATWGILTVRDPLSALRGVAGTMFLAVRQYAKRRRLLQGLQKAGAPGAALPAEAAIIAQANGGNCIPSAEEPAR